MTLISSSHAGAAIIDALELKHKYIKRIQINLDVNELVFCTVEFYPEEEQMKAVSRALKAVKASYALAELTDDDVEERPN